MPTKTITIRIHKKEKEKPEEGLPDKPARRRGPTDSLEPVKVIPRNSPKVTAHAGNVFLEDGIVSGVTYNRALETVVTIPLLSPTGPSDLSPSGLDEIPFKYVRGGLTGHSPTIWDLKDFGYRKIARAFQIHPLVPTGYSGLEVSSGQAQYPLVGDPHWKLRTAQFAQEASELYYPAGYAGVQYTLRPNAFTGRRALDSSTSPYFEDLDFNDKTNFKCTANPNFDDVSVEPPKIGPRDTCKLILFPRLWLWHLSFTEWFTWGGTPQHGVPATFAGALDPLSPGGFSLSLQNSYSLKQCWSLTASTTALTGPGDPSSATGSVPTPTILVPEGTHEAIISPVDGDTAVRLSLKASSLWAYNLLIMDPGRGDTLGALTGVSAPGPISSDEDISDGFLTISLDNSYPGMLVAALEKNADASSRRYLWRTVFKPNSGILYEGPYDDMKIQQSDLNLVFGAPESQWRLRYPATYPDEDPGHTIPASFSSTRAIMSTPKSYPIDFAIGC